MKKGCIIGPGEEILMAYGGNYWKRWGNSKRKREQTQEQRDNDYKAARGGAMEAEQEQEREQCKRAKGGADGVGREGVAMEVGEERCAGGDGARARAGEAAGGREGRSGLALARLFEKFYQKLGRGKERENF